MMDRAAMSLAAHLVTVLAFVLATGCASGRHAQTEPVATAAPAASIPVAETPQAPAPPAPPPPAIEPERPVAPTPATQAAVPKAPVAPATPVAPGRTPPKSAEAVAVTRAPAPAATPAPAPVVTPAPEPAPAVAPRVAPAPAAPRPDSAPLDLKSLESRLRQTGAIGMFTKLSLKNQVDDLVDKFRAYHRRQGSESLADLRRMYDMLFMKVLSLLQDSDPSLARDIVKSRSAIWSILEDPRKFTESNLMAGATP